MSEEFKVFDCVDSTGQICLSVLTKENTLVVSLSVEVSARLASEVLRIQRLNDRDAEEHAGAVEEEQLSTDIVRADPNDCHIACSTCLSDVGNRCIIMIAGKPRVLWHTVHTKRFLEAQEPPPPEPTAAEKLAAVMNAKPPKP